MNLDLKNYYSGLLSTNQKGEVGYWVSKDWIQRISHLNCTNMIEWKRKNSQMEATMTQDIICEHGNLSIEEKDRRLIPEQVM